MPLAAITGPPASGKSKVLVFLKKKGAKVFDSDKIVHSYYRDRSSQVFIRIKKSFPEVFRNGKICRKRLAAITLKDTEKLRKLEGIVHPAVIAVLLDWVKDGRTRGGVFTAEVPLLFEKKLDGYFDYVVTVRAPREILLKRLIDKYKINRAQALSRLNMHLPENKKKKKACFVIKNNSSIDCLQKEVDKLWKKIR